MTDQAISREPGLLPYIYVDHIDDTIEQVEAQEIGVRPRQCSPLSVVRKRRSMRPLPPGRDRDEMMQDPAVKGQQDHT